MELLNIHRHEPARRPMSPDDSVSVREKVLSFARVVRRKKSR